MPLGGLNPCPFRVGGGAAPASKTYVAMRRAVGVGGSAQNDLGIDGLWRRSRAKGVAAGASCSVRACLQAWPNVATDALDSFARVLGTVQHTGESEADYRQRIWAAWVLHLQVDVPTLLQQLRAIDSRFSILEPGLTTTTHFGRAFGPHATAETPAWGMFVDPSDWPNFSTDLTVFVRLTLGYAGGPSLGDQRIIEAAKAFLTSALSSWVSSEVLTEVGFHLGHSPLDRTGLT